MPGNLILFNKPFGVLCQFSGEHPTLADFIQDKGYYPAGRLDKDSEGLVALTNDGQLQHRIANPGKKMSKTYWVQVEGLPDETALQVLRTGVELKDGLTRPAHCSLMPCPLAPRQPPVRYRKNVPTAWLELTISEGRNRQVRRMTAAVGFPTLRLFRHRIGPWDTSGLPPGECAFLTVNLPRSTTRRAR
jgi:23S rRNA pseudouridine2457 synthase